MHPTHMLEFVGGLATIPFYLATLYLFFSRVRSRYEKRGLFFTMGLLLIVFSYFSEFWGDHYAVTWLTTLSNGLFGLAGISMIISCYFSIKWLDATSQKKGEA